MRRSAARLGRPYQVYDAPGYPVTITLCDWVVKERTAVAMAHSLTSDLGIQDLFCQGFPAFRVEFWRRIDEFSIRGCRFP